MSETFLRQIILEELEYEPSLDATHIGVAVEKGVVSLTGHVASFAQKQAAFTAVRRIHGVRAIADEMEVRYPFEQKIDDEESPNGLSMSWAGIASCPIERSRSSSEMAG
jgi:hypothetical protein